MVTVDATRIEHHERDARELARVGALGQGFGQLDGILVEIGDVVADRQLLPGFQSAGRTTSALTLRGRPEARDSAGEGVEKWTESRPSVATWAPAESRVCSRVGAAQPAKTNRHRMRGRITRNYRAIRDPNRSRGAISGPPAAGDREQRRCALPVVAPAGRHESIPAASGVLRNALRTDPCSEGSLR